MDYRERWQDHEESFNQSFDGRESAIFTAIPGIVQSVSSLAGAITVTVQPATTATLELPDHTMKQVRLPILPDVPVVWQRGGGYTLTFPVQPGDECLVVMSMTCIDSWWQQGGVQPQSENRLHDINDGFAIVGPFSQATKIGNISTNTVQLRANDHNRYVEVDNSNDLIRVLTGAGENYINVDSKNNQIFMSSNNGVDTVTVDGKNNNALISTGSGTNTVLVDARGNHILASSGRGSQTVDINTTAEQILLSSNFGAASIDINGGLGQVFISADGVAQTLRMDSVADTITIASGPTQTVTVDGSTNRILIDSNGTSVDVNHGTNTISLVAGTMSGTLNGNANTIIFEAGSAVNAILDGLHANVAINAGGTAYSLNGSAGTVGITAPVSLTVNSPLCTMTGQLNVSGPIVATGQIISDGQITANVGTTDPVNMTAHTHAYIPGTGAISQTNAPTPGT